MLVSIKTVGTVVVGGVLAVLGVGMLIGGLLNLHRSRKMAASDSSSPGDVDSGTALVEGTARATDGEALAVPGSKRDVLAYEYRVTRERRVDSVGGTTERDSTTLDRGTETLPFVVEGPTGSVRVDPEGADISIESDTGPVDPETFVDEATDADPDPETRLNYGVDGEYKLLDFSALEPGETVTVSGTAELTPGAEHRANIRSQNGAGVGLKIFEGTADAATSQTTQNAVSTTVLGLVLALAGSGLIYLVLL